MFLENINFKKMIVLEYQLLWLTQTTSNQLSFSYIKVINIMIPSKCIIYLYVYICV